MWTKELEMNTRIADAYLGGITVGEIRGEARGIKMEKSKMITRLNDQNIPLEVISNAAEMSVSEVLEIIKSSKLTVN